MKKILFIAGLFIVVLALTALASYIVDYQDLSAYGKGYIWGKVILLLIGIFFIYWGKKKRPRKP